MKNKKRIYSAKFMKQGKPYKETFFTTEKQIDKIIDKMVDDNTITNLSVNLIK